MSSRRLFLKAGLLAGGATLVGGGLYYKRMMDSRAIAGQLSNFLDHPDLAKSAGQGLLEAEGGVENASLERMIDNVLLALDLSRDRLEAETRDGLLNRLHASVRSDFIEEHIVLINGWVLSRTEAQLCALLYLVELDDKTG